jgi:hypothetical protein
LETLEVEVVEPVFQVQELADRVQEDGVMFRGGGSALRGSVCAKDVHGLRDDDHADELKRRLKAVRGYGGKVAILLDAFTAVAQERLLDRVIVANVAA